MLNSDIGYREFYYIMCLFVIRFIGLIFWLKFGCIKCILGILEYIGNLFYFL